MLSFIVPPHCAHSPGKTALDVGCGVGGPMRTVAAVRCAVQGCAVPSGDYPGKAALWHASL